MHLEILMKQYLELSQVVPETCKTQRELKLEKTIDKLKEATRPFYACVFNDNGDIEINQSHLSRRDWMKLNNVFRDSE